VYTLTLCRSRRKEDFAMKELFAFQSWQLPF